MIVLVIGLVAVIIVILIAVFLSVRLGRGDDHDEHEMRPADRVRRDDLRPRDRDRRDAHRPAAPAARERSRAGAYDGHSERRRERDATGRSRDTGYSQRRAGRYDSGPQDYDGDRDSTSRDRDRGQPRRPVAATPGGRRADPARPARERSAESRGDRYRAPAALYDTGPVPRAGSDDFPSGEFPAADYPSAPMPAADYPSGDYTSGSFPAADYPSDEFPAARAPAQPKPKTPSRDRTDARRKPTKEQNPPKGKGRSKRGDDDDWPSMEWDKLSDEQYWAELSSDKPLATTARTAQPSGSAPKADPARPAPAKADPGRPAAAKPKPKQPVPPAKAQSPATDRGRSTDQRRDSTDLPREPATERLPVRVRQQPATPARREIGAPAASRPGVATDPPASQPAGEPSLAMLASLAGPGAGRGPEPADDDPLTSPSFSRKAIPALDSRSYGNSRRSGRASDTGGMPRISDRPGDSGFPASYPPSGNGHSEGYPAASGPAGGGYPNAGMHTANGHASAGGPGAGGFSTNGHGVNGHSGGYPPSDYPAPAYNGYQAAPVQPDRVQPDRAQQPDSWYGAPAGQPAPAGQEQAQPLANPYGSYVDEAASYPAPGPVPGYPEVSGGYDGYPGTVADGYQQQASAYQVPAPPPYQEALGGPPQAQLPGGQDSYPGMYAQPTEPAGEHAGQAPYQQPYSQDDYPADGYGGGYGSDPYGPGGYGGYAAQG